MSRPSKTMAPGGRRKKAADQVEEGGLAGAVRPDDRAQFALRHVQRNVAHRDEIAEALGDVLDFENVHALLRCRKPSKPARKEQHDQHEQQADERHPVDGDARQIILQHHEHRGAEQRPPEAAHAAHHRHHDEIARLAVMQAARVGEIVDQRIERAGKAHEEAGQREGDPDMPLDRECRGSGRGARSRGSRSWCGRTASAG